MNVPIFFPVEIDLEGPPQDDDKDSGYVLCVWKPRKHQLDQLRIQYTYVSTEGPAYREHFGAKEHNYSHWLCLNHTAEWMDLARFLFMNPEAASPAKRDATPLRLLSWLSFRLEPAVDKLIEAPCCASPP